MKKNIQKKREKSYVTALLVAVTFVVGFLIVYVAGENDVFAVKYDSTATTTIPVLSKPVPPPIPQLDIALYDKKLAQLANSVVVIASSTATSTHVTSSIGSASSSLATSTPAIKHLWPVKTVYPNAGALLPFNRIVAYYGNFYSTSMGILGQYSEDQVLTLLKQAVQKWTLADPTTPVIPAIHYIAVTAQGLPGDDGKYRLRMPDSQIDKALEMAKKINGLVFLDVQVGQSTVQSEIPALKKYLMLPNVHLGIDPEFSMKTGKKPGSIIGTMDATDVNFTAQYLANLVKENNLPPKILVVHRFTQGMVTHASLIKPLPEVQIVMDMDGWGAASHKKKAYHDFVYAEPVQFAGIKLFYKNDLRSPSTGMMTPADVLNLKPQPSYIQYQ